MKDKDCPTTARTNTLTVAQAADLAEIARTFDMTVQCFLFIEVAFILADGGVVEEDFSSEIDMLRTTAAARPDVRLKDHQMNLIGARSRKLLPFPSEAYALLSSLSMPLGWPWLG